MAATRVLASVFRLVFGWRFPTSPILPSATVMADHTQADFANPGDLPVRIAASGKAGRFVRITATQLWKRTGDWCLAIAEMVVLSDKTDIARGAAVSALDSIEASPSWAQVNLVDGYSSLEQLQFEGDGELTHRQQLAVEIGKLDAERTRLFESLLAADARRQMTGVSEQLADVRRQAEALPPQQMVFAATHEFAPLAHAHRRRKTSAGLFARPRRRPQPAGADGSGRGGVGPRS